MTAEDLKTFSGTTATATKNLDVNVADCLPPVSADESEKRKKKRRSSGSFGFLKAASSIFRTKKKQQKSNEKQQKKVSDQDEDGADRKAKKQGENSWKNIVGCMRPLTLQGKSPAISPSPTAPDLQALVPQGGLESPAPSYVSSGGTMSRYASASDLQELDACDNEDDPDEVFDAITGDEMIDTKAEEFINQFYQQMKLQTEPNQY
ncbi:PREDICTED: uncharacterized protein LOC109182590 [Ipomoea nil]|uniref:uncharacterized protein LOC109182590 n=1 Tax=Ipomoea nil TaxID=35883 RepID=UPI000900BAEC|nr:PREDICTED: uncharacterized protein LOC109182590 [Ipomoea nil]